MYGREYFGDAAVLVAGEVGVYPIMSKSWLVPTTQFL